MVKLFRTTDLFNNNHANTSSTVQSKQFIISIDNNNNNNKNIEFAFRLAGNISTEYFNGYRFVRNTKILSCINNSSENEFRPKRGIVFRPCASPQVFADVIVPPKVTAVRSENISTVYHLELVNDIHIHILSK
jgi:hypothetical protein